MAELFLAEVNNQKFLILVGCAGSFYDRVQKITKAFGQILNKAKVSFCFCF